MFEAHVVLLLMPFNILAHSRLLPPGGDAYYTDVKQNNMEYKGMPSFQTKAYFIS
jgi:hypothetical protein